MDFLMDLLGVFREFLVGRLAELFPHPSSALAAGILLGSQSAKLPHEVFSDFQKTGLTHILAVSGFNIVILVSALGAAFTIFPRKIASATILVILFLFVLLTGATPSVVRAGIMGSLSVVARLAGRRSAGLRALGITAAAMLIFDFSIIADIGFQLSFAATAGLILLAKPFDNFFASKCRLPEWGGIREIWSSTLAAQVFTLPLILFYFQGFFLLSPIVNVIILPFIPYLMLGSFLALIFGKIIAAPTWLLFEAVLAVVHFFAEIGNS